MHSIGERPLQVQSLATSTGGHRFSATQISKMVRSCPKLFQLHPEMTIFPNLEENTDERSSSQFTQIYRSREVGQSYFTSVLTTLITLAYKLWLVIRIRPQVILCNRSGTYVPLCIIAFLFKVVGIR
ncbi:hypothetical protein ACFX11_036017 [Malus domestica]